MAATQHHSTASGGTWASRYNTKKKRFFLKMMDRFRNLQAILAQGPPNLLCMAPVCPRGQSEHESFSVTSLTAVSPQPGFNRSYCRVRRSRLSRPWVPKPSSLPPNTELVQDLSLASLTTPSPLPFPDPEQVHLPPLSLQLFCKNSHPNLLKG